MAGMHLLLRGTPAIGPHLRQRLLGSLIVRYSSAYSTFKNACQGFASERVWLGEGMVAGAGWADGVVCLGQCLVVDASGRLDCQVCQKGRRLE